MEDEEGKFLTVPAEGPEVDDLTRSTEYSESGDDANEELDTLREENRALQSMIRYLTLRPSLRMRGHILERCGEQTAGLLLNMIPLFQLKTRE